MFQVEVKSQDLWGFYWCIGFWKPSSVPKSLHQNMEVPTLTERAERSKKYYSNNI